VLEFLKTKGTVKNKPFWKIGTRGTVANTIARQNLTTVLNGIEEFGLDSVGRVRCPVRRQNADPARNSSFHRGICHFKLLAIW